MEHRHETTSAIDDTATNDAQRSWLRELECAINAIIDFYCLRHRTCLCLYRRHSASQHPQDTSYATHHLGAQRTYSRAWP